MERPLATVTDRAPADGASAVPDRPVPTSNPPLSLAEAAAARLARWQTEAGLAAGQPQVAALVAERVAARQRARETASAPEPASAVAGAPLPTVASELRLPPQGVPANPWQGLRQRLAERGRVAELEEGSLVVSSSGEGEAVAAPAWPRSTDQPIGLKAVDLFRPDWTQLAVKKRLGQARRRVPQAAGPLNSHGLLARVLDAMGEASPAYMQRLLPYAEALVRLEDLLGTAAPEGRDVVASPSAKAAPRAAGRRRSNSDRLID